MDWTIFSVIIATGIVTSTGTMLVSWQQNRWSIKREISGTRRKYREEIASKIREALGKIQGRRSWIKISELISHKAVENGVEVDEASKEFFAQFKKENEAKQIHEISKDFVPLISTITHGETREVIKKTLVDVLLNSDVFNMTKDDEVEKQIEVAYKQLEDFVALADK